MWMIQPTAEELYILDSYAAMTFQPGKTRNEDVAVYVHAVLS